MDLRALLQMVVDEGASDLHITNDSAPVLRIDGQMRPVIGYSRLTPRDTAQLCLSILTPEQREEFIETHELDLSIGVRDLCRFRVNLFIQKEAVAGVFRVIPSQVKPIEELGLPSSVSDLSRNTAGLVLVTGPTGSGKSTTLAAMVDQIHSWTRSWSGWGLVRAGVIVESISWKTTTPPGRSASATARTTARGSGRYIKTRRATAAS